MLDLHDTFMNQLDSLYTKRPIRKHPVGTIFRDLIFSEKKEYLDKFVDISPNTFDTWNRSNKKTVPTADTLLRLANHFHVSVDYLLGNCNAPDDYDEFFIHEYIGLDYDAIQMIKLFYTNPKFVKENRNCLDMLNLLLSSHYQEISKHNGNNNTTHNNIFNSMWEYIHADSGYYNSLDADSFEANQNKYIYVGFNEDSVSMLPIADAIKFRSQKYIFNKLDNLSESQ